MAILRAILFGFIAIALAFYSFFWAHESRLSWFDPKPVLAAAAKYDAKIVRDRFGVPHISGKRDADVAYGLGYAHAEDDFASIERAILEARGRLAIVDGFAAMDSDYIVQLLGIWDAINAHYASSLTPELRAVLDGYATGINLYATQHRATVLPGAAPVRGEDIAALFMLRLPFSFGLDNQVRALMGLTPDTGSPLRGLAVAVAPSRSADGATRLLIKPQGPFSGPLSWYEARVTSGEGWNMEGATIPGSPFFLAGAGPQLGWGLSANHPDLTEIYTLEGNPNDANFYRYDGEWHRLETSAARIVVKLFGSIRWTFRRGIWRSVQGPVIRTAEGLRAIHYAGQDDVRAVEAFYRLNKAQNFAAFDAALGLQAIPSLSFVYADRLGRIATIYNGAFPDRAAGYDWSKPVPGNVAPAFWRSYLPFDAVPKTVSPPGGFVVAADGTPFHATAEPYNPKPESFAPSIGVETDLTNRQRRALTLFGGDRSITAAEFARYSFDGCYAPDSKLALIVKDLGESNFAGDPLLEEAGEVLRRYDLCTDKKNRGTALAVMTAIPILTARATGQSEPNGGDILRAQANGLLSAFGRVDPTWEQVSRLRRGPHDLPLAGGPDALHDVEAVPYARNGTFAAGAGDALVLISSWARGGQWSVSSVAPLGASTVPGAKHYADQAPLYAGEMLKEVSLTDVALMKEATQVENPKPPSPKAKTAKR